MRQRSGLSTVVADAVLALSRRGRGDKREEREREKKIREKEERRKKKWRKKFDARERGLVHTAKKKENSR